MPSVARPKSPKGVLMDGTDDADTVLGRAKPSQ
jgi:hypothetical protein